MNQSLYHYSLYIALPLMLFFGFHMLFARVPDKKIFSRFLLSRRLIGTALLILAANYSVHLFFSIRLTDVNATILMNMATYFLCYWLFSSAMMTLLDNSYVTRHRFSLHMSMWLAYSALALGVSLLPDGSGTQAWATIALAAWLVVYGLFLAIRLLRTYTRAIKMFENTHSDDIGAYVRWLSIFTYWAIGFGVSCSLLTFLPDEYVFIWILSSIPFYIYLYCCYQNYILFYEKVETAFLEDDLMYESDKSKLNGSIGTEVPPVYHSDIARRIEEWVNADGYCKSGITLNELSLQLCTNRTYLSEYINGVYQMNFRDWISDLRIGYAKRMMERHPQMKIQEISESSGFISTSHFTRTFSEKEGCSPARWRKLQLHVE
ncbi:MAG: helix-turn-helix domain-containing protein [Muribaculaceae bacterium]